MTKTSKIMVAATSLAMLGFAALPMASFASPTSNTTVEVTVDSECLIGNGANTSGAALLEINLDSTTPTLADIDEGTAGSSIDITCNEGWTLVEKAENDLATATNELALKDELVGSPTEGKYNGAIGFTALPTPFAPATPGAPDVTDVQGASFTAKTWAMAYTGADVQTAGSNWHTPGVTNGVAIASNTIGVLKSSILQFFGAKTDNTVPGGTYGAKITYTLAPVTTP